METPSGPAVEPPPAAPGRLRRWQERLTTHRWFRRGRWVYHRHQRYAPPLFFFGGVLWDALTLRRIDAWFDDALLLAYLIVLGVLIVVAALVEYECGPHARLEAFRTWYPLAIQFFLGALFSAHLIFYFQSASLAPTLLFVGLLLVLLVANEFIHDRLFNLYLLLALYFLAACSFFIFFIPVVTKTMTYGTFLAGGILSLGLIGVMLLYLARHAVFRQRREYLYAMALVGLLFSMLNLFYVQNWIPPVPLAMRYGGVFHHVSRAGPAYELRFEPPPWYAFWSSTAPRFHRAAGQPVYGFAAVFAPTQLKKQIVHTWSVYDEAQQAWVVTDRIGYELVGGRFKGYRGYTVKQNVRPGRWRIDVETEAGRLIGRIRFEVLPVPAPLTDLKQVVYE